MISCHDQMSLKIGMDLVKESQHKCMKKFQDYLILSINDKNI